jgi:hypothetical protein
MPRKTFVAGEVLLAQDVNQFLMDQSVMNFASSAARSSAIPTPTEGMVTYRSDIDDLELYDGSSFVRVGGLTLLKSQTFSAVSSVLIDDVFTSKYRNYRIVLSSTGTASNARARLRAGGTSDQGSVYLETSIFSESNTATGSNATRTELRFHRGEILPTKCYSVADIYGVNLAENTFSLSTFRSDVPSSGVTTTVVNTLTQYDGIELLPSSGTISGQVIIFGVKE